MKGVPSSRSLQYRRVALVTHEDVKQMHIFDMMVNAIWLHACRKPSCPTSGELCCATL